MKRNVIAAILWCASLSAHAELPAYPFVHTSGTGFRAVMPDRGEIDFEVKASDADPAQARAVLDARIAEVRALMTAQQMSDDAIEVRDVRVELHAVDPAAPATAPLSDMVCSVHIEVKDLANWRALMQPLLAIKNLDHFSTAFKTTERDTIEAELIAKAIVDARRKAEGMAQAAGKKLGPATAISSGELRDLTSAIGLQRGRPEQQANSNARNEQETRDLLMINLLKLAQSADVVFRLK